MPALQLDLTRVIWRRIMMFFCPLFSNKTLWLIVHLLSAVLSNWLPWTQHVNVILPGTALHWHGEHEVASKTAFPPPHPRDLIVIPSEGTVSLPRCKISGMQMDVGTLYGRHQCTWPCREGGESKLQHKAAELGLTSHSCLQLTGMNLRG